MAFVLQSSRVHILVQTIVMKVLCGVFKSVGISAYISNFAKACGGKVSAPVQTDSGAHPASYTMGTGFLSRG